MPTDVRLPETYADGWKRKPDDEFAYALFVAIVDNGSDDHVADWSAMQEWQRDEYRAAARVARERLSPRDHRDLVTRDAIITDLRAQLLVAWEAMNHYADADQWIDNVDYVGDGESDGPDVAKAALCKIAAPAAPARDKKPSA